MFYQEDPEFEADELEAATDKPEDPKEILGMSRNELIILGVLLVVIVVLAGLLISRAFGDKTGSPQGGSVPPATATLRPTKTPVPSATPVPTSTPIPGWSQFEFDGGQAQIWLPSSYQGGDTVEFEEIVLLTLYVYLDDPAFIESVTPLVTDDAIIFFAFDTESPEVVRFVYAARESIPVGSFYPVEDFLTSMTESLAPGSSRISERGHVILDYYPDAGYVVFEEQVDYSDATLTYVSLPTYGIPIGDQLWTLSFQVGRDDYAAYRATIDSIARSFSTQPIAGQP